MSTFATTDLFLSSYIVAMGADMPAVRVSPGGRCQFEFADEEGGIGWLAQEWRVADENRAQCSAPKLFSALRKLRQAISEAKGATLSR